MGKLEELLNSLIEKGWLPRGDKNWKNNTRITNIYFRQDENGKLPHIRMIVSKESGLWQFVCENGMINIPGYKNIIRQGVDAKRHKYYGKDYRYWLCESALKDESEIEDFLLSNIAIKDEE